MSIFTEAERAALEEASYGRASYNTTQLAAYAKSLALALKQSDAKQALYYIGTLSRLLGAVTDGLELGAPEADTLDTIGRKLMKRSTDHM